MKVTMHKERFTGFLFVLVCLLKFASLVNVFDGEYCILKCYKTPKTNSSTINITWHKIDSSNVTVNISTVMDKQIIMKKDLLEIWPLSSNDSGTYFCNMQGTKFKVVRLEVKENKMDYCNDSSSAIVLKKNYGVPTTIKVPNEYISSNNSIKWYKNCKHYAENVSDISFNSVTPKEAAIYTYIITRMHNGKYYNASRTTRLIVEGPKEMTMPKIKGIEKHVTTEVELGQNLSIKCEAAGVVRRSVELYWLTKGQYLSDNLYKCNPIINNTCSTKQTYREKEQIMSTELHLINISMDDITYQYVCKLDSKFGVELKTYTLKLKEKNHDMSKNVFTMAVIAATTCSVSIVFLVLLCVLFRIQIVLLYRNIMRLDETIGDGKHYDAYLSFEGFANLESEEREFAFQTLAPILENHFGFKLCIFERDGVPGKALVDDVHSLLEKSRRLIIVLSKKYTSDMAMYELESGLYKAMVERKIKVILIEFTPLSELSVLPESLQLVKMRNRVRWKGDKSRPLKSKFWKTILYLMPAKAIKSTSYFYIRSIYE